jgi:hypothetical protein
LDSGRGFDESWQAGMTFGTRHLPSLPGAGLRAVALATWGRGQARTADLATARAIRASAKAGMLNHGPREYWNTPVEGPRRQGEVRQGIRWAT